MIATVFKGLEMQRYLVHFSYFGTRFRGMQKRTSRQQNLESLDEKSAETVYRSEEDTVQGALESAIWTAARPENNRVVFNASSRTDRGVHALCNTGHMDLATSLVTNKHPSPRQLTTLLNQLMLSRSLDIRVMRTLAVPPTFHSRYLVRSRTYLYRLAIVPRSSVCDLPEEVIRHQWRGAPVDHRASRGKKRQTAAKANNCITTHLTQLEEGFYYEIRKKEDFNLNLFRSALSLFVGEHNFSNFTRSKGRLKYSKTEDRGYVARERTAEELTKRIDLISVDERPPPLPPSLHPLYQENHIMFLDVVVRGQSFLWNQVRRMVGAAVAVATGEVELDLVRRMLALDESTDMNCVSVMRNAPPHGLYLASVNYEEGAMDVGTDVDREMLSMEKVQPTDVDQEMVGTTELCVAASRS